MWTNSHRVHSRTKGFFFMRQLFIYNFHSSIFKFELVLFLREFSFAQTLGFSILHFLSTTKWRCDTWFHISLGSSFWGLWRASRRCRAFCSSSWCPRRILGEALRLYAPRKWLKFQWRGILEYFQKDKSSWSNTIKAANENLYRSNWFSKENSISPKSTVNPR